MIVQLPQLNKTLSCKKEENLFRFLRASDIPLASSCNGEGVCGKCVVEIVRGAENLSPATELEIKLQQKHELRKDQRISCQCEAIGDGKIEIRTSYW